MKINMFNLSIWLCFAILTLWVGVYHEPWADEAQAWLIARDASVWEILSQYARCEGQPPLWHLLLHFLIKGGFPYSAFYLIPWVFSCIGIALFLWKSPFPKWAKALIPFTYFIFFQYTIIARQYCMAFMFLSLVAILYPNRHNRPFLYAFILCLFGFSSTPSLLIAGSLYFLFLCENLSLQEAKKENWIASGLIFVFMCFIAWVVFPDLTNPFVSNKYKNVTPIEKFLTSLPVVITLPFFSDDTSNVSIFKIFLYIFTTLFIGSFFWKNKKNLLYVFVLFMPLILFLGGIHYSLWHLGFLYLLFLFSLWIFYDTDQWRGFKQNVKLWIFTYLLLFHVGWTVICSGYDILNSYSKSKEVAEFISPCVQQNKVIIGADFWTVSIQPYFDKNIYQNFETGFWVYKKDAKQFHLLEFLEKQPYPDVIIYYPTFLGLFGADEEEDFIKEITKTNLYTTSTFLSRIAIKQVGWESQPIWVLVKKELK